MKYFILLWVMIQLLGCSSTPAHKEHKSITNDVRSIDRGISEMEQGVRDLKKLSGEKNTPSNRVYQNKGQGSASKAFDEKLGR